MNKDTIYSTEPFSVVNVFDQKDMFFRIKPKSKLIGSANFLIFLLAFVFTIVLVASIFLGINAFIPCLFERCAQNAVCVNRAFKPECKCKKGFNGNAKYYCDECGLTFQQDNSDLRIVGGNEAVKHSWPSAVQILISYKTIADLNGSRLLVSKESFCGGTIIDAFTVMTAAHCIIKSFSYFYNETIYEINVTTNVFHATIGSIYTVYVGAHNTIQTDTDLLSAKPIAVSDVIPHESYDEINILNDIALLKLNERLVLNERVQIACLPDPSELVYPSNTEVSSVVVGWGVLREGGEGASSLQNVKITIYKPETCANSTLNMNVSWTSQICAGDYLGGKDSCQGDSGGSLFVKDIVNNKIKYISAGIVSYGEGCARAFLPGVYTRVSYFIDWILNHLNY